MQALIEFILRQLRAFWPFSVVQEWKIGILVRNGVIRRTLLPGLHWRWLFIEEVITYAGTECSLDLGTSAIMTSDGRHVAISANLGYRMIDMAQNYRTLWDTERTLAALALGRLASSCAAMPLDRLRSDRIGVEEQLLDEMKTLASGWGLEIKRLHLTDCVPLRAHRHYVDGMNSSKTSS